MTRGEVEVAVAVGIRVEGETRVGQEKRDRVRLYVVENDPLVGRVGVVDFEIRH